MHLTDKLIQDWEEVKDKIHVRLFEFEQVPLENYFYEFCFCLCTPQSKAENALKVQLKLQELDFKNREIDPLKILFDKANYIRFHNVKAKRLIQAKRYFTEIEKILSSQLSPIEKRSLIKNKANGFGLKESAHFMRNIGYKGLAILDRHILACMKECKVIDEIPNVGNEKIYFDIEQKFNEFSNKISISIDELDLLFWFTKAREIIK